MRWSSHYSLALLSGDITREYKEGMLSIGGKAVAKTVNVLADGSGYRRRACTAALDAAGQGVRLFTHYALAAASGDMTREFQEVTLNSSGGAVARAVCILCDGSGFRRRICTAAIDAAGQGVRLSTHYALAMASGDLTRDLKGAILDASSKSMVYCSSLLHDARGYRSRVIDYMCGRTCALATHYVKLILENSVTSPDLLTKLSPRKGDSFELLTSLDAAPKGGDLAVAGFVAISMIGSLHNIPVQSEALALLRRLALALIPVTGALSMWYSSWLEQSNLLAGPGKLGRQVRNVASNVASASCPPGLTSPCSSCLPCFPGTVPSCCWRRRTSFKLCHLDPPCPLFSFLTWTFHFHFKLTLSLVLRILVEQTIVHLLHMASFVPVLALEFVCQKVAPPLPRLQLPNLSLSLLQLSTKPL